MKNIFFSFVLSLTSSLAFSHEYFFAFAEVGYNSSSKAFEISLEASAHVVEDAMNEAGISIQELEDHYTDLDMQKKIERFISSGLSFQLGDKAAVLLLRGFEVKTNGLVYFYLESEPIDIGKTIAVKFDWLMDQLDKQQNKLTFKTESFQTTVAFLQQKRSEIITINE